MEPDKITVGNTLIHIILSTVDHAEIYNILSHMGKYV